MPDVDQASAAKERMSLSSSAWFTGDDGPADPPSERPAPPVAAPVSAARTLPVTPAERCLAAMLRSWLEWYALKDDEPRGSARTIMLDMWELFDVRRLVDDTGAITPAGAALLARVEAAPGYEQGRRDAIADAADHLSACHDPTITPRNAARMIVDHEAARLAGATPLDAPPAKEPR